MSSSRLPLLFFFSLSKAEHQSDASSQAAVSLALKVQQIRGGWLHGEFLTRTHTRANEARTSISIRVSFFPKDDSD